MRNPLQGKTDIRCHAIGNHLGNELSIYYNILDVRYDCPYAIVIGMICQSLSYRFLVLCGSPDWRRKQGLEPNGVTTDYVIVLKD